MKLALVLGTGREGRASEHVYTYLKKYIEEHSSDISLSAYDVRDFAQVQTYEEWNEHEETKKWKAVASNADAFLFVVPEYNWGYPGELKNVLDQALPEYLGKPVLVAGVSAGRFGGARVIVGLIPVLFEIGLVHIPYPLYFPHAEDIGKGSYEDFVQEHGKRIDKSLNKLLVYSKRLQGIGAELQ